MPSTLTGVKVHLTELVGVVCPALQSRSWPVKAQAASAIATITHNMGKGVAATNGCSCVDREVLLMQDPVLGRHTWLPWLCICWMDCKEVYGMVR